MTDPHRNWRVGIHTVLTLMLIFTAVMQSAVFAQPLMPTAQHSHVERSNGETAAAGEIVESLTADDDVASLFGEAIEQNCEQHCLSGYHLPSAYPAMGPPASQLLVARTDQNLVRGDPGTNDRPPKIPA